MKCNIIEFYRKTDLKYQMFFKQKLKALINIEFRKFRFAGYRNKVAENGGRKMENKNLPNYFFSSVQNFYT